MRFGVLGPLWVAGNGKALPLRSAKQRILLATLLSQANAPVSQRRLIEALWDAPPASAAENLRLYIYQLRRALGDGDRIGRHPSGYAMAVHPGELDALEFDRSAGAGSRALADGDSARASELLAGALSLWRGPAYGDLADLPVLRPAAVRLEEARLRATEERITADLRLGRHAEPVAELISLTEAHPYREPIRAQLMRALYSAGRQAEALEVYRQTRALLIEELGIEPGPELRRLHELMLRGEWLPDSGPDQGERADRVELADRGEAPCPYLGLLPFQPEHERWFFGRSVLVERLVAQVARFGVVGVFGASGSGKSSLLRAGLLGRLDADPGWRTLLMTPTAHPLDALAGQLAALSGGAAADLRERLADDPATLDITVRTTLAAGPEESRALLVVDQLEEIFTLVRDDRERDRFVAALLDAALGDRRRTTVVLGVRADFLAHVTKLPGLVAALPGEATLLVGPPSPAELREIVVRPAVLAGASVDAELLATVLADLGAEPGALPLLSHALSETWRNRSGDALTLRAYQASGGVRGAIAQSAERVHDALDERQRRAMRMILVRLTALGEGTEDTRRPITRAELDGIADPEVIAAVLQHLADARLIVLSEDTVEVAHEALIRAWPRLHRWLSDNRTDLVVHRRLTTAATAWRELDEDPGALYRGAQLDAAAAWAREHPGELNRAEEAFLRASQLLQRDEHLAARRTARLRGRLVVALAVLLVVALTGAAVAVWQGRQAELRQRIEQAHQLALTARQLLDTDPNLAGLLAVEAHRLNPDADTRGALLSTASAARRRVDLNTGGPPIFDVTLSPDGTRLAAANRDGGVDVWDLASRARLVTLTEHTGHVEGSYARTVAFDRAGGLLASTAKGPTVGSSAGSLVVWDTREWRPVFQRRFERITNAMALSPDGRTVAVGTGGGAVEVWDLPTGTSRVLAGHAHEVESLAISPDGTLLVSTNVRESPVVWDLAAGARLATVDAAGVHTVAFDPEGGTLATGSTRDGVRLFHLAGGQAEPLAELPLPSPYAWDISAPLGGRIAVTDEYGLITIWDTVRLAPVVSYQDRGRAEARSLVLGRSGAMLASGGLGRTIAVRERAVSPFDGHGDGVNDIDVSPRGDIVASAGKDRTVRLWDGDGNQVAVLGEHTDRVESLAFSPDGRRLVALTRNHTVTVWDVDARRRVTTFGYQGLGASTDIAYGGGSLITASSGRFRWDAETLEEKAFPGPPSVATALESTPDGKFLVSVDPAGGMLVWDLAADRQAHRVATGQGDVRDVAVSRDGTLIATSGADRTVKLWDARTMTEVAVLTGHTAPAQVLAFSNDGSSLASGSEDRTITVWNVPSRQRTATLTGHRAPVQALTFTPAGDLISGADDGRIIRWSLAPDSAAAKICAEVGRGLSEQEWTTHLPGEAYRHTC